MKTAWIVRPRNEGTLTFQYHPQDQPPSLVIFSPHHRGRGEGKGMQRDMNAAVNNNAEGKDTIMRRELALTVICLLSPTLAWGQFGIFGDQTAEEAGGASATSIPGPPTTKVKVESPKSGLSVGRFQLVTSSNESKSLFLIDTATGCMWQRLENQKANRSTFVEVNVENLHWSYGSGTQQLLTDRIEGSTLTDVQKRALKEELRKTGCGLSSNLVLTPGRPQPQGGGQ